MPSTRAEVRRISQKITDPNETERRWVAGNVDLAREIAKASGLSLDPGGPLDPATLDAAWVAWLSGHDRVGDDPNPYINAFGLAFGQHLVDRFGLEWKVVQDADGTEIAVWGQQGDVLVFPPNLVGKRYVAGTTAFFADVARQIEQQVTEVRATTGEQASTGLGRFFRRGR